MVREAVSTGICRVCKCTRPIIGILCRPCTVRLTKITFNTGNPVDATIVDVLNARQVHHKRQKLVNYYKLNEPAYLKLK